MSSYEVRAIKFIHQIYRYVNECHDPIEFMVAIDKFNLEHNRKVKYDYGQTRMVFITSDYVIKLDYDPEHVQRWGGCASEHKFYEFAYRENMAYLFAKIKPYYYNGMVFYIMPRVRGIGRRDMDAECFMTPYEQDWCSDNDVWDLHFMNYGWKDGHIVIIDYSANRFM